MYRSYIACGSAGKKIQILASAVFLSLGCGWTATAKAADSLPSMKYATAGSLGAAINTDARFDLMAGEYDLNDNCDPLPLAADSTATIVLAKLDDDKKPRPARSSKTDKANSSASASRASLADVAPAAAPALSPVAADGSRDWEIVVSDKTLNAAMARWAAAAGWQLLWELPVDYAVEARTRVHGTFEEAISIVAGGMESAEIPMKAVFYQGNKVLRIMAKGNE